MKAILDIIIILFAVSLFVAIIYALYMGTKKNQYPTVDFSRFKDTGNDVAGIEQLANKAIRGVNGWMWLATAFMVVYYFLNFWSIVFMLLNIVVVAYEVQDSKDIILFLVSGSLLFTCLDLWLNSKDKSAHFHAQWFNTSAIAKEYIVKFSEANTFEELCKIVIEFNSKIYKENAPVHFL